jgi:tetratricopeptide (TPR) repeat protein
MRRASGLRRRLAAMARVAFLTVMLLATGCGAARMVGIGGSKPAAPGAVARSEPAPAKSTKAKHEKRGRGGAPGREQAAATDDLAVARARASEQPSEPWWPYQVADLEAKAGRREASEAALKEALARAPGYAPALTSISKLLYVQGRHEEAVALLSPVRDGSVVMDADDRATALAGLALHEAARGRDEHARAALDALERAGLGGAIAVSAFLAVRGTDRDAALALTAEAVRAAPRSAASHNNRGIALLRAADPDAAEKAFERAIELDPALPGPYYNLAILERFYRMDVGRATQHFQRYWARSHADPDSLFAELGRGSAKPAPVAEEGEAR